MSAPVFVALPPPDAVWHQLRALFGATFSGATLVVVRVDEEHVQVHTYTFPPVELTS